MGLVEAKVLPPARILVRDGLVERRRGDRPVPLRSLVKMVPQLLQNTKMRTAELVSGNECVGTLTTARVYYLDGATQRHAGMEPARVSGGSEASPRYLLR